MMLALLVVSLAKAEEITRQQALQRAQQFMQERMKARPGSRGAKVELSDVKQVSGLYVVNASDNEGYVIVSNDDQTVPILGFSDSGHADPDKILPLLPAQDHFQQYFCNRRAHRRRCQR